MSGVYLAYPIDQANPNQVVQDITDWVKEWLGEQLEVTWTFDPGAAFTAKGERTPAIRAINRKALEEADVLIAIMPRGETSIGVPMEIERAIGVGKPTLVLSDAPSWMLEFEPGENGLVWPRWDGWAKRWVSEALQRASEVTRRPERVDMPVVVPPGAEEPRRGYDDDAGLDLVVEKTVTVPPGEFVDIPCGVQVQLPPWSWGLITGRSSALRRLGLMVAQGVIDAGYRGPLFTGVWNLTDKDVTVSAGDRVAQLIVIENATRLVQLRKVDELEPSERGLNGFGSTGS